MAVIRPKATVIKTKEAPPSTPGNISGIHVGEVLRQAREARGQTIEMITDELMIRRFYLEALENGSFKDLPERVYATGFVRNYATYLGLEAGPLVDQFRREAYGTRNTNYQVDLIMPQPIIHSVIPGKAAIIAAGVVLVVLIGGVIFAARDKSTSVPAIPAPPAAVTEAAPAVPVPTVTAAAPVTAPSAPTATTNSTPAVTPATPAATEENPEFIGAPSSSTDAATAPAATSNVNASLPAPTTKATLPGGTAAPATAAQKGVSLEAIQSSWVEVKDKTGNILFTNILKQGQLLPLPEENVTVTTGNAGGLRIVVDGQPQEALGQVNEVKRNVPLDPAKLHQH